MKNYTTIQVVTLTAGVLELSEDQARRRKHLIKPVEGEDDVYEIIAPCQFKVGERFGYEGFDLTLALARRFEGGEEALIEQRAGEKVAAEKAAKKKANNKKPSAVVGFFAGIFGKKSDDDLTDEEKSFADLVNVIDTIDKASTDLWTKDRGPRLNVLHEISGNAELTEMQRDAAWETWQQKKEAEQAE